MTEHVVCSTEKFEDQERVFIECNGIEIAVFKIDGEFYAYANYCPHQGAPMCEGELVGTTKASYNKSKLEYNIEWTKEGKILACPWHGWQYDITSGCSVHNTSDLLSFPVKTKNGNLVVEI